MEKNLDTDLWRYGEAALRNLWYYSTGELGRIAGSTGSEEDRLPCVAELFVREFLNPDSAAEEIDAVLPDGELTEFRKLIPADFLDARPKGELLRNELWSPQNDFSRKCLTAVRKRLIELCEYTDGFIPVFIRNKEAFFIPFHFTAGAGPITDLTGNAIADWQQPYSELFGTESVYRCVVHCDQSGLPYLLNGRSLMLPLYLAYLRKRGDLEYNHLRLIATGAVTGGRLEAVETGEKAAALKNCFGGAYLFFPESTKYCPDKPNEVPLKQMTLGEIKDVMAKHIDACGLVVPTLRDAMKRLENITSEREGNYRGWGLMLSRLENNLRAIKPFRAPEYYLLGLMLKSSIYCHMGKTDIALTVNREARDFAKEHGFIQKLRRLEVEQLVDLQDKDDFKSITGLAKPLRENIESLKDHDLLMRYCGTMGQAHCYGTLAGIAGFDPNTAKKYFDEALSHAVALADIEESAVAENNIAQDLNYQFLWHALFSPETPESECAYRNALDHIKCELSGDAYEKNRRHLCRIKAFSLYRRYLQDGIANAEGAADLLLPRDAFWLAAVTGKYVGALQAATGNISEAADIFRDCADVLRGEKDPILRFIQMTILAEAWRSTRDATYRDEALGMLDALKMDYPASIAAWEGFLYGKNAFPGLNYWY